MNAPRIRRILCPTDFSSFSRAAALYAGALARRHEAEIEFLHVVPIILPMVGEMPFATVVASLSEGSRDNLKKDLEAIAAPLRKDGLGVKAGYAEGDPFSVILAHAQASGCDLIVMGTHGTRGFERFLLGSVAERVLVKAPCSVLTVGQTNGTGSVTNGSFPERILCALGLSNGSGAPLGMSLLLARKAKSVLGAVHCIEELPAEEAAGEDAYMLPSERDYRRELRERVKTRFDQVVPESADGTGAIERVLVSGRAHEAILRVAKERRADLIVLGARERKILGIAAIGSTVRHVVRGADCPVLTVRAAPD
jgi:nucleotide-binding universal stress UspA family protein